MINSCIKANIPLSSAFCALLCFCAVQNVCAQQDATEKRPGIFQRWEIHKQARIEEGRSIITPILAPAYSPELGFLIAGGGLWTFKTDKSDSLLNRSSMPFTLAYSTTGAILLQFKLTSYWFSDKIRFDVSGNYRDMPDHYFGVGFEAGADILQSDSTTAYQRNYWRFDPRLLYQFKKNHFAGLIFDINYTQGSEESTGVQSDSTYNLYNENPMNTGIGLVYRFDSRDIPVNAYKGLFFDIRAVFYDRVLGGDNDYTIYTADLRKYWALNKKGRTLAFRYIARFATGGVPYGEMSQIGGSSDLRGYRHGRYRDKSNMMLIGEYRHMFYKRNASMSKHGVVGWVGTGTVFDGDEGSLLRSSWLPNFGLGYRFEVEPRMNIRLDYGFGNDTQGFYLNFNEAF